MGSSCGGHHDRHQTGMHACGARHHRTPIAGASTPTLGSLLGGAAPLV